MDCAEITKAIEAARLCLDVAQRYLESGDSTKSAEALDRAALLAQAAGRIQQPFLSDAERAEGEVLIRKATIYVVADLDADPQ